MAISKSLLVNILVICWLAFEVSGGRELLPCIHKLLLCEAYLKGPVSPPAGCCVPLREMGNNDVPCLCDVFNNQPFLKTLNITQAEALNLAQTCGANTDTSLCSQEAAAPSGSPYIPAAPSSNSSSETSAAPKKSTVSLVGVSLFLAAVFSIIVSLF
ncbi:non-specific lipid transfer protein GPI-anchored 3-like [Salvia hispanica]|uniref:non-specific lipid transfer protein GPI-anchored 3-like n=1 Tax=Salvia hispanica TaxID=49212 RepID=UPI0020090D70|nr:non-specific lipid transfer protein GPI-anchored 3-like [Salvia hispanica]